MSTAAVYEKPTDDLRQVRHEEWAGDHLLVYFTTQRRWEITESPYQYLTHVWRDLPAVRATELGLQPPYFNTK